MRSAWILIAVLSAGSAWATTYRWVDAQGVVHYSDRPVPGAQIVDLHESQTYQAQTPTSALSAAGAQAASSTAAAQISAYTKLDLWRPLNDETFTNTGNTVTVRLRLEPDLQPGDSIWLYLDGKRVDGLPGSGESFTLNDVFRGTHTLNAVVAGSDGKPLIRSQSVTFHMHQASLLSPARRQQAPMGPG